MLVKWGSLIPVDEGDGLRPLSVSLYRQRLPLLEDLDPSNRDTVSVRALCRRVSREYAVYNGRRTGRQALTTPRLVSISVQKIAGANMSVARWLVAVRHVRDYVGDSHVPSESGSFKAPNASITYANRTTPVTITREPNRKIPITAIFRGVGICSFETL